MAFQEWLLSSGHLWRTTDDCYLLIKSIQYFLTASAGTVSWTIFNSLTHKLDNKYSSMGPITLLVELAACFLFHLFCLLKSRFAVRRSMFVSNKIIKEFKKLINRLKSCLACWLFKRRKWVLFPLQEIFCSFLLKKIEICWPMQAFLLSP